MQNTKLNSFYKNSVIPFVIVAISSTFYLYEFFLRVLPGVLSYEIMHDMQIDAATLSMIGTSFYYGYITMQIPIGLLCDRFGPKKLLTISVATCSIATVIFAYSHSILLSATARAVVGVASAAALIAPLTLATKWYDKKHFALITGMVQLLGCIGAIGGGVPIAALSQHTSWRQSILWSAVIGGVLTILYILIIKDSPNKEDNHKKHRSFKEELQKVKKVAANIQNWYTGIAAMCCWAPIAVFSELWGIPFLMDLQKIDNAAAASEAAWVWYGIALGSPIVGWFSDRISSRRIPIALCAIIGLISATILIYAHVESVITIETLLFFFGLSAASQPVTFGLIVDNNPDEIIGTAIGFNNMAAISGALLQVLVGVLISTMWQGKMLSGTPVYTIYEFKYAFAVIPCISLLAIFTAFFLIKETDCKRVNN
ncbi:MAG: MFS transporter [Legionellales bacterium]|jgi:MFS family permease|nr:MFS transporter [Legionellales bacterium]